MMQKLERLIDLMIAHYEGKAAPAGAEVPAKPKTTRKPKEDKSPEIIAAAPQPPAAPEMTDKESYDELCRLAIGYIAADKPDTEKRRAYAMKHVEETYRVSALSGVPHGPQRLQLVGWFKSQLGAAAPTATLAPAGFGV